MKSLVALLRKLGFEIDESKDICEDFTDIQAITVNVKKVSAFLVALQRFLRDLH